MKKIFVLLSIILFFSIAVFAQGTSLTIGTKQANVGDTVRVPINASNFLNIGAISLSINYNNQQLQFLGLENSAVSFASNSTSSTINLGWFDPTASNPLSIASGKLSDLKFIVLNAGNLSFATANCEIANAAGDPIVVSYFNGGVTLSVPELSIENVIATPGSSVSVPIRVSNFSLIGAVSLKLNYNNSGLIFNGISNSNGLSFTSNNIGSEITIGWFDATGTTPLSLTNGTALLNLNFNYINGVNPITFNSASSELTSSNGLPISGVIYNNGGVTPLQGTAPVISLSDVYNIPGAQVSVPLTAQNISNVGAFSIKINYNAASATFTGISGSHNGISIDANASAGVITLGWIDFTSLNPITIASGVLTNLNFTYNGGTSGLTFNTSQSEFVNSNGNIISGIVYQNGSISLLMPPTVPTLSSPVNGALNHSINTTLVWSKSATATSYRLQVAKDQAFTDLIMDQGNLTDTSYSLSSLQNSTKYYWRVNASNAGGTSSYSNIFDFTTIIAAPNAPVLTSPLNAALNQATSLNLIWSSVVGASSYRVQVSTSSNFSSLLIDDSTITGTSKNVSNLENSTQYYWRVCASNIGGTSAYSSVFSFTTIIAVPAVPTLLSPVNNSANQATELTLSWNAVAGASTYRVQVSTDVNFSILVMDDATISGTSKNITGLLNSTQYYWRVNATNLGGTSGYSNVWSFTTIIAAPSVPLLTAPSNGAVNQATSLTLSWGSVTGASSYRVQVATDNSFNNLVVDDANVVLTSKQISGLSNSTQYFWRVSASNLGGTSSYSTGWSFNTIIAVPSAPTLASPANNAVNQSTSLTLSWNAVAGASSYAVQVASDAAFNNLFVNDLNVTGTTRSVSGLLNNTTYYWRVSATNINGTSTYSTIFSFTTIVPIAGVPVLQYPSNNALNQPLSLTLLWDAVSGVASYRVQLATDAAFANLVVNDSTVITNSKAVSGLLNNTQYYWRVNAKNAGGTSVYSSTFIFTTIVAVPGVPSLSSPTNNATNQSTSLTLSWSAVTGAASYAVQVATDNAFNNVVIYDPSVSGTSKLISGLLNNTQYYWRVSSSNAGGSSAYSSAYSFTTVVAAAGVPVLQSPINNAVNQSVSLTLTWGAVPGATSYRVQLATDMGFTNLVVNDSTVTTNSKAVSGLLNSTQYYWRVNAKNSGGTSVYSSTFTFTTIVAVPGVPSLSSPANNAANQSTSLTLSWSAVTGAASYAVQVATDNAFNNVVIYDPSVIGTSKLISGLLNNTQYYWRVSSSNAGGTSGYSNPFSFTTVVAAPGTPILQLPANNATNQPVSLTLTWGAVSEAVSYRVQLATDMGFTNLVVNDSTVATNSKAVSGLLNSTQYYWRVNAKNAGGTSYFSDPFSFTTIVAAPAIPILSTPANNSANQATSLTLTWNSVAGAVSYGLQLATDSLFTNLVINEQGITLINKFVGPLLNGTKYYWRVNSSNPAGTSSYSSVFNFTTVVAAPACVTLQLPANYAVNQPVNPLLQWSATSGAETYGVQLAMDSLFSNLIFNDSTITSNSVQVGPLLNNVKYFWRVNARNAGGTSPFSEKWNFTTIVAVPIVPQPQLPPNNSNNQPYEVLLTWNQVTGATLYHLQVSTNLSFSEIIFEDSTLTSFSKLVKDLQGFTKYYWRVKSSNLAGSSSYSEIYSFMTHIDVPVLLTPANGSLTYTDVNFTWSSVNGAESYRLQLAKDSLFTNIVIDDSSSTDTSFYVSGLDLNINYFWRVRAKNSSSTGSYSLTFNFIVIVTDVDDISIPTEYMLYQNYPNPFNPATIIKYDIPHEGLVTVKVYNMLGEEVASLVDEYKSAGRYEIKFDAQNYSSGIYIYRIHTKEFTFAKKMILVK
jgi:large repetitive protein